MVEPRARTRPFVPEPPIAEAGCVVSAHLSVDTVDQLMAEVRRRNVAFPLAAEWTVERLLEELINKAFPRRITR